MRKFLRSKISDYIAYGLLACMALGCNAGYHVAKAESHKQKAIAKGAVYKDTTQTVFVEVHDTTYVDGEVIIDTIKVKVDCPDVKVEVPKTKTEIRQENRTERKKIKEENKTERNNKDEETKQEKNEQKHEERQTKIENKCSMFWTAIGKASWIIFFIGAVFGFFISRKI